MKKVSITGTSSGIGKTIAQYLSEKGHQVMGTSRSPKKSATIRQLPLDVMDDWSVTHCVATAHKEVGSIDVLVNNAGIVLAGSVEDTSIEEAKRQFDTNYFGVVRMIQATLPYMKAQGKGLIINISSIGGLIGLPFQAHYCAIKFALEGLVEGLPLELRPFNVNVLNINPGDFKTEITSNRQWTNATSEDYKQPLKTMLDSYEESERNGSDPVLIAKLVDKLIRQETGYKIRYTVGKTDQKMLIPLRKIIGDRLFEKLMIKSSPLKEVRSQTEN